MAHQHSEHAYALITGGSSGIGLELSKLFAADSFNLVIVSKPEDELKKGKETLRSMFPDVEIKTIQKDLSIQDSALEVYHEVKDAGIEIDILVNNAGFATYGYINDISIEKELSMINLNVVTLYHLSRLFIADMVKKDKGKVLNVSSTAALNPQPHFTTYAATKAFSLHFSEALNFELKHVGSSVRVTTLCPPPVRTGFQKAAGMEKSTLFDKPVTMEAPDVAKAAYDALFKEKSMIIPSASFSFLLKIIGLFPKNFRMKALMDGLK
jgi:short-subunit dehydrogenase